MSGPGRRLAVAAGVALAAQYVPSVVSLGQWAPVRRLPGGLCAWRGGTDRPVVALTVDDGPDPDHTPAVLDALERLGLVATFFCLGERVDAHPGLVKEITAWGHAVGTHGQTHAHHLLRGPRFPGRDLDAALLGLRTVADIVPRWYRPPYGQAGGATLAAARRRGLRPVLWSAWGREWDATDARAVAATVRCGLRPGAVVLLHDSDVTSPAGSAGRALGALDDIARDMDRLGLRAAPLDEVIGG